ncbi:hypothetical protein N9934_02160 [Desulfosarcina sp.]|nr:hypothetical protein [Desulfosarcina sp.]
MDHINPSWLNRPREISIVVDNDSWILPYAMDLVCKINEAGDRANLCRHYDEISQGEVAFYLGCINITPSDIRSRNRYNLVVHESDLPNGRGFAPLTWQILEGKNTVTACLLAAEDDVDAGPIYLRKKLCFRGDELNREIREVQGRITVELCMEFLESPAPLKEIPQDGEPTYYLRRRPSDSQLDVHKTIAELFNLLRVVDNERYPAFFEIDGVRYRITIEKF